MCGVRILAVTWYVYFTTKNVAVSGSVFARGGFGGEIMCEHILNGTVAGTWKCARGGVLGVGGGGYEKCLGNGRGMFSDFNPYLPFLCSGCSVVCIFGLVRLHHN